MSSSKGKELNDLCPFWCRVLLNVSTDAFILLIPPFLPAVDISLLRDTRFVKNESPEKKWLNFANKNEWVDEQSIRISNTIKDDDEESHCSTKVDGETVTVASNTNLLLMADGSSYANILLPLALLLSVPWSKIPKIWKSVFSGILINSVLCYWYPSTPCVDVPRRHAAGAPLPLSWRVLSGRSLRWTCTSVYGVRT